MKPHFKALEAAYQLHYYVWLKTRYLQPLLNTEDRQRFLLAAISDVCVRHDYHLLETDVDSTHVRLLVSLRPQQDIAHAVRLLKGNIQYEFGKAFGDKRLLGRGYFARTSGTVDIEQSRKYVDSQIAHHGYAGEWTNPLKYRNHHFRSPAFHFQHCFTILNYHLAFATHARKHIFDETIGPQLFEYLIAVGKKHLFAVDRIGLLPDHMHMIIEGMPSRSVETYAQAILNNTQHWMASRYAGVLKQTDGWDVWHPSYYAGTVGEFTSAQLGQFLRSR